MSTTSTIPASTSSILDVLFPNDAPSPVYSSPLIDAARAYGARGWVLVPMKHDKKSLGEWRDVSTATNATTLHTLSIPYTTANGQPLYPQLAIQCGLSDLVVIDVDVKNNKPGVASLAKLQEEFGELPPTPRAQSASGGFHYYFRGETPKRVDFRPGIDIQSHGSLIICPPTVNSEGKPYTWCPGWGLEDVEIAPIPLWVFDELAKKDTPKDTKSFDGSTSGRRTTGTWLTTPYDTGCGDYIHQGTRDGTLYSLGCSYRVQGFEEAAIAEKLLHINRECCLPPLEESIVYQKAASACIHPLGTSRRSLRALVESRYIPIMGQEPQQEDTLSRAQAYTNDAIEVDNPELVFAPAVIQCFRDLLPAETVGFLAQLRKDCAGFADREKSFLDVIQATSDQADSDQGEDTDLIQNHVGELTEAGNAARLLTTYTNDVVRVTPGWGWGVWSQQRWLIDREEATDAVKRFALSENLRLSRLMEPLNDEMDKEEKNRNKILFGWTKQSQNDANINSSIRIAAALCQRRMDYMTFDNAPMLLQVPNGTLDLQTGELREPRREDFLTVRSPVSYDPQATCPKFLEFLHKILDGDAEMVRYIQWLFGFCLIGHNLKQLLFFFEGDGSNGKSMLATIFMKVLGPDLSLLSDPKVLYQATGGGKEVRNDIAGYHRKRLIVLSESETNERLAEAFVKRATGEESLLGEHKYGRAFAIPVTFKFIQLSQHLPKIYGQDWGIWRRIRVVPFLGTVSEDERDESFFNNVMRRELPGILRWGVQGTQLFQDCREDALPIPQVMVERMKSYRDESDFFGSFTEDMLVFSPNGFLPETRLSAIAKHWGQDHNVPSLMNAASSYYPTALRNYMKNNAITHPLVRNKRRAKELLPTGEEQPGDGKLSMGFTGVELSKEGKELYALLNRKMLTKTFGI